MGPLTSTTTGEKPDPHTFMGGTTDAANNDHFCVRDPGADSHRVRAELSLEAGTPDHDHRAMGRGRLDRPGDPRRRGRDRKGARPEGRDRQPGRRIRLDRDQERAGRREGRLYLDRGRCQGHRHLCGQRPARHQVLRLAALPERRQRVGAGRQSRHALQDRTGSRRCDEGQAERRVGRDRRHQLVRPCRDRGVHPRARPDLQACQL